MAGMEAVGTGVVAWESAGVAVCGAPGSAPGVPLGSRCFGVLGCPGCAVIREGRSGSGVCG